MGAQMKTPDNRHFEGTSKGFARSQRIGLRRALTALLVLAFLAALVLFLEPFAVLAPNQEPALFQPRRVKIKRPRAMSSGNR